MRSVRRVRGSYASAYVCRVDGCGAVLTPVAPVPLPRTGVGPAVEHRHDENAAGIVERDVGEPSASWPGGIDERPPTLGPAPEASGPEHRVGAGRGARNEKHCAPSRVV